MSTPNDIVIVGGGLAGAKAAEALRDHGYDGRLTLLGEEEHLPYERPPLSKEYLAGTADRATLDVHDQSWYAEHRVDLMLGKTATAVRPDTKQVELIDGRRVGYDRLLLATGSRARTLPLPGANAPGVFTLRSVDDADALGAALEDAGRLVVVGGGWIGMETAANARGRGVDVTVVESASLPLAAVLGQELAQVFLDLHREHDITFYLEASVTGFRTSGGEVSGVTLADGTHLSADAVVVGVGAQPNLTLAESAGLDIDTGVLVDATLRSSDPHIWAVGDIAQHQHPVLNTRVRVEHWATALNQPATAAASMLGGDATYEELPYFFSDQYDLGMEYVGHAPPGDYRRVVTRGDLDVREFIAFWLDADDRVLAGMNVNVWDVVEDVKALILARQPVDVDRLTRSDIPLTSLLDTGYDETRHR